MDVHYPDAGGACAALVLTSDKQFADLVEERSVWLPTIEAYQRGQFYLRELLPSPPCWLPPPASTC